jgi:hypothetical protein
MTSGISIAIPLGFLLLAGALCWFLVDVKGRWPLKILLTVLLAFFSLETWRALDSYSGWPSGETIPQRGLLYDVIVREPNPKTNDPGAIFLWIVPLGQDDPEPFSYRPISGEPRAYKLPYSRPSHEQAAAAKGAIQQRNGQPILIERGGQPGEGGGMGGGNHTTYEDGGGFRIGDAPSPSVPPKVPLDSQGH